MYIYIYIHTHRHTAYSRFPARHDDVLNALWRCTQGGAHRLCDPLRVFMHLQVRCFDAHVCKVPAPPCRAGDDSVIGVIGVFEESADRSQRIAEARELGWSALFFSRAAAEQAGRFVLSFEPKAGQKGMHWQTRVFLCVKSRRHSQIEPICSERTEPRPRMLNAVELNTDLD